MVVFCNCEGPFYQYTTEYNVKSGDSYEKIANDIFHGFTSCWMLRSKNLNFDSSSKVSIGRRIVVPLLCACPSEAQKSNGIEALAVYMVQSNDSIGSIAKDIGVEKETIFKANMLSNSSLVFPFTPLLVPLPPSFSHNYNNNQTVFLSREGETSFIPIIIILSSIGAVLALLCCVCCGCLGHRLLNKKRSRRLYQKKLFKQNGGLLLQQKLLEDNERVQIFTQEELEQATDNYNETRFLGQGGYGTVYKGILQDNNTVAIKRSKQIQANFIGQFINDVLILSRINHKNIVKLLGCCLETEFPLLVYEFVPNGTLSHHIHKKDHEESATISWKTRLRIASEVAGAISYIHSTASTPIFHRDIKSLNVLLDDNFSAKLSDFGTSRFFSYDQTHLTTEVQGTFGYIDPEYFRSSQYTEKSDVYSFGVLMVELLTGKKPVTFGKDEGENLLDYFISLEKANELVDILDAEVAKEEHMEVVKFVAQLTSKCLRTHGKERPTMKEVYLELEGLKQSQDCLPIFEENQSITTYSSHYSSETARFDF
ncbi:unnamed protein product [Citrullus colocynthis]|uniref:Uncharacterized protein n=1 Tax=Citrullus colocynthis TaxID=252529 RepID=A0ABP0Z4Z6_9ROSI